MMILNNINPNIRLYLIAVIIALVAVLFVYFRSCQSEKQLVTDVKTVQDSKTKPPVQTKDESGNNHATQQIASTSIDIAKAAGYEKEIDSLKKLLKIKDGQIKFYQGIGTTNTGTVTPIIISEKRDTTGCETEFSYSDYWTKINGTIASKGKPSIVNYSVRDSLMATVYKKGNKTFLDAYSLNPNVTVLGLSGFEIATKSAGRWGIGPYIGYGYGFGKWSPNIGVSLHYSLIRF